MLLGILAKLIPSSTALYLIFGTSVCVRVREGGEKQREKGREREI